MAAQSKLAWHVDCDLCGHSTLDDDEPMVYDTADEAIQYAVDSDWLRSDDGRIACPDHWQLAIETSTGWALPGISTSPEPTCDCGSFDGGHPGDCAISTTPAGGDGS